MTKNEAIFFLLWCQPLANKLATQGIDIELTEEDQIALKGFCRVWAFGWLEEFGFSWLAGLSVSEIELLTAKMLQEITRRE
jgi:hypothetical protein